MGRDPGDLSPGNVHHALHMRNIAFQGESVSGRFDHDGRRNSAAQCDLITISDHGAQVDEIFRPQTWIKAACGRDPDPIALFAECVTERGDEPLVSPTRTYRAGPLPRNGTGSRARKGSVRCGPTSSKGIVSRRQRVIPRSPHHWIMVSTSPQFSPCSTTLLILTYTPTAKAASVRRAPPPRAPLNGRSAP